MNEKDLNPQESMAVISRMISRTNSQLEASVGRHMLIGGYSCVVVAAMVMAAVYLTGNLMWNYLWFCIPVFIFVGELALGRKDVKMPSTFLGKVIGRIWRMIGFFFVLSSLICFAFNMSGASHVIYNILFIFTFPVMGLGCIATGAVICNRLFLNIGIAGMLTGTILSCLFFVSKGLVVSWWMIVVYFMVILLMVIVPGHILMRRNS